MKRTSVGLSVSESADRIKQSLQDRGFTIFADIDHQANAQKAGLEMPESRVLIFGNPLAGTKLMQKDIAISLDLPIRIAFVEDKGATTILHQTAEDYSNNYDVAAHPVLEKIESLFDIVLSGLR